MEDIEFTFSHSAIMVRDMERSIQFYERAVGWRRLFEVDHAAELGAANGYGGTGKTVMGKLGGVPLQLVHMNVDLEPRQKSNVCGLFMCSVLVQDLEPARKRLASAGIPITRELDVGGTRLIVITDPDGQEIGIVLAPPGFKGFMDM